MLSTLFTALLGSYSTIVPLVGAYNTLYELNDVTATVYYDSGWESNGDQCSGRFGIGWSVGQAGVPHCEQNGPLLDDLGTNHVVAMNATWLEEDASAWCGKEVKVFKPDGSEVQFDQPLVLWDACAACVTEARLDFGVTPYLNLDSTDCGSQGNNPSGLTVKVVDNQIWAPAPGSDSYSPTSASTLYTGGGYNLGNPMNTNVPPWSTGAGTASAAATVVTSSSGAGVTSASSKTIVSSSSFAGAGTTSSAIGTAATSVATSISSNGLNFKTENSLVSIAQSGTISISASASATAVSTSASAARTPAAASASGTSNVVALSSTGTCETPGAQECQGLSLYVCTYTTSGSSTLGWVLQNTCRTTCSTDRGVLTCE